MRAGGGMLALREGAPIVLSPGASDADFVSARALQGALAERCGLRLPIEGHARTRDLGPCVELRREGDTGEAYRLRVTRERAVVTGAGEAGLRWGAETLGQLAGPRGRIPGCAIEDAPDLPHRGLMLDVSRGKVPTAATLRALVDVLARMKCNVLVLYVEHPFRFRRHPKIGEGSSPLDAETLRELDAYAAARQVELVPSLQSLGHMERILSLPEYAHLAESPARWTVSPADPGTYALLEDLYDELLPGFRSPLFIANCDEPFDLPSGRSAAREAELGPGGVYLEHLRRVRDLAAKHGRRTAVWGDVVHAHPERIPQLPRDLLLLDWWYEAEHDYDRVAVFARHGLDFWVCPGTSSWNCLFPRVENSLANIAGYAAAGRRHGAKGLLVTDWGDFGHYNLQGNSWLAVAWAAQQAWSGDAAARDFDRAFGRVLFGEERGRAARAYRELGAVHEAGFRVFNASPLQHLFFDDLGRGFFAEGARPAALRRSRRRLERARERLLAARAAFGRDGQTFEELVYAADASLLAVRKGAAGHAYLRWRRRPGSLAAGERRRLVRALARLAGEQADLRRRLRRLWLARSRPSNLAMTERRIARSVRSLRRAARALERNRPPPPPPPHPGFSAGTVLREVVSSTRR